MEKDFWKIENFLRLKNGRNEVRKSMWKMCKKIFARTSNLIQNKKIYFKTFPAARKRDYYLYERKIFLCIVLTSFVCWTSYTNFSLQTVLFQVFVLFSHNLKKQSSFTLKSFGQLMRLQMTEVQVWKTCFNPRSWSKIFQVISKDTLRLSNTMACCVTTNLIFLFKNMKLVHSLLISIQKIYVLCR